MCSCLWECAVNIKEWLRKQSRIVLSSVFSFCLKIVKLIADRSPTLLRGTNWFLLLHFFLLISYFISQPIERDGWTMHEKWNKTNICCFPDFCLLCQTGSDCRFRLKQQFVHWHHSESHPRLMHCASWGMKREEILLIWFLITNCDVLLVLVTNLLSKQKKPICLRSFVGDGGREATDYLLSFFV